MACLLIYADESAFMTQIHVCNFGKLFNFPFTKHVLIMSKNSIQFVIWTSKSRAGLF